jgi:lipopolysaccharide heptosyltransferase II
MLTLPYTASLARLHPLVDEVVEIDTNLIRHPRTLLASATWREYARVYRYLRAQRFDLALSIYGRMGSLCAFLSGALRTVAYAAEAYPFLLTDPVPGGRHRERVPEIEYVQRLATFAGGKPQPSRFHLRAPAGARSAVDRLFVDAGLSHEAVVVVIHAGSRNGVAKRWPSGSWSRFADELYQRTGARVILVGASSDAAIADTVVKGARFPIISLAGKTSVEQLIAVLERADLVASGDSGPLHLAAALGRPLLAVYGPTDPAIYGPHEPKGDIVLHRIDLPCSPCYTLASTAECPLGDPICMRLVSVSQMVESAIRLLESAPQRTK